MSHELTDESEDEASLLEDMGKLSALADLAKAPESMETGST